MNIRNLIDAEVHAAESCLCDFDATTGTAQRDASCPVDHAPVESYTVTRGLA